MAHDLPLKDVKICDFMWVMAGPASTRILADYGATVVRIESPTRIDTARTLQPYFNNQLGPDSSGLFGNCNAGKFGISLDLGNAASRAVVHDLVRWADVVTESFSPKAMRAWGFDYESLRKVNPQAHHAELVPDGAVGTAGEARGLRQHGSRDFGISQSHRMARPSARGPVRRLHRLRGAAFFRDGDSCGARPSSPHRRGAIHRSIAG